MAAAETRNCKRCIFHTQHTVHKYRLPKHPTWECTLRKASKQAQNPRNATIKKPSGMRRQASHAPCFSKGAGLFDDVNAANGPDASPPPVTQCLLTCPMAQLLQASSGLAGIASPALNNSFASLARKGQVLSGTSQEGSKVLN